VTRGRAKFGKTWVTNKAGMKEGRFLIPPKAFSLPLQEGGGIREAEETMGQGEERGTGLGVYGNLGEGEGKVVLLLTGRDSPSISISGKKKGRSPHKKMMAQLYSQNGEEEGDKSAYQALLRS